MLDNEQGSRHESEERQLGDEERRPRERSAKGTMRVNGMSSSKSEQEEGAWDEGVVKCSPEQC